MPRHIIHQLEWPKPDLGRPDSEALEIRQFRDEEQVKKDRWRLRRARFKAFWTRDRTELRQVSREIAQESINRIHSTSRRYAQLKDQL